ncbi:MAG: Crp/Fnr family transcriptional regulator, partial [Gammaproteobacteria bacterium]|nr:Crp/Fnr family transcriptional regulator [Gammaproteobacteria bacterium]
MDTTTLTEPALYTAFLMGLISASSLPMGAVIGLYWHPRERTVAILMAFGGGALLAALTIDLVASSVAAGHYYPMAFGAILGGLIFISLNQILNDYGAFARKASTTFYHLRRRQDEEMRKITARIERVES